MPYCFYWTGLSTEKTIALRLNSGALVDLVLTGLNISFSLVKNQKKLIFMNAILLSFIGPQEIVIILTLIIFIVLIGLFILALIKYIRRPANRSRSISKELENQFSKFQNKSFEPEDIRDYYPVKEGNKITLIRFDEIVDFSASNNYIFLTDTSGKDYLVESNLADLESKLPKDFIRVHKSTIINSKQIAEVKKLGNGRFDLVMKCDKKRVISCSKNYNERIKSIIDF